MGQAMNVKMSQAVPVLLLGATICLHYYSTFFGNGNACSTPFPPGQGSVESYKMIRVAVDTNSSANLDTEGFVCAMLDTPGVKQRSEASVYFRKSSIPARTLIVLAHYFDALGRDNLQFFLAQGLVPDSAYHFVVVINGPIPMGWEAKLNKITEAYPNFEWHTHVNTGYDFCVYKDVLSSMLLKISIKDVRYFILLNKSLRGPFVPSYYERPWPDIFTSRLKGQVKLSGTSINCGDGKKISLHVQSMLWAFSADILPFMLGRLKCFQDKWDAVINLEVGLPKALVAEGFRFASTMRMLDSKEGVPDTNTDAICAWSGAQADRNTEGDQYAPGSYAGMDLNPLETIFFKANRQVGVKLLKQYSIFALMNNNFTVPARIICGVSRE